LAVVTTFEVLSYVCVHALPVEILHQALIGFVNAIGPGQKWALLSAVGTSEATWLGSN